jgi:hypothetical protein
MPEQFGAVLLSDATANGPGEPVVWNGGPAFFEVTGTFGKASVRLEMSRDGGSTWVPADLPESTISYSSDRQVLELRLPRCLVRGNLLNASAATSLSARIG